MDHQNVEISFMVVEDLDEIIAIENTSFTTPWTRNIFLQEMHLQISCNLVAKITKIQTKEMAGYIIFWMIADETHRQRVATRKDLQRLGIASKLMEEMVRLSDKEGVARCILEVGRSNESAIHLYKKFGFTLQGVRPLYYSERGEDALIMRADIRECVKLIHYEL